MRTILIATAMLLGAVACAPPRAQAYGSGVTVREILKTRTAADGTRLVYLQAADPELTVAEVNLAPGAETGWHHHPVPVYAYVQEGELEVRLAGGSVRTYVQGQAIAEVMQLPHNGRNVGKGPVRLVVFYCGARGLPNVVREPSGR